MSYIGAIKISISNYLSFTKKFSTPLAVLRRSFNGGETPLKKMFLNQILRYKLSHSLADIPAWRKISAIKNLEISLL